MNNSSRVFTPAAPKAQAERSSAKAYAHRMAEGFPDRVTPELAKFIGEQDTAFLATASGDGAPYLQHRGGPKGFIKVIDEKTLGFADYRGNRQYITTGNLSENPKAFIFLMDYANRGRVKIWGEAKVVENDPELVKQLFPDGYRAQAEQAIVFTITAWDGNCPSHIPQKIDAADVAAAFEARDRRIAALEAEVARLKS
jgi:predicted pyridoxine 5'-phosphate oxidase superfamily flavin-nucleotide-binding protein